VNVEDLVHALCEAIVRGDDEAVAALSTPDSTVWHNFDGVAERPAADGLKLLHSALDEVSVEVDRMLQFPSGFVLQFALRGTVKANGEPFVSRSCIVVDVENGKLARTYEYADSAPFAGLFG
jgi:ketosteroid isomerase-like protein